MKKNEFKNTVYDLFDTNIEGMSYEEKINYIEKLIYDYQRDRDDMRDKPNSRKPWSDEELMLILNDAPTVKNCVKHAKLFGRGYGSIEQIYRWAATSNKTISERNYETNKFIEQIKRVCRKLGRRA